MIAQTAQEEEFIIIKEPIVYAWMKTHFIMEQNA